MFTHCNFELINAGAAKIYLDLCDARTRTLENKLRYLPPHTLTADEVAQLKAEILEARAVANEAHRAGLEFCQTGNDYDIFFAR